MINNFKTFYLSIRANFFYFKRARNRHDFISEKIKWSILAKIGRAPIMRLTILVPLLGTLLFFNEQTTIWLKLSPFFVTDLGLEDGDEFTFSALYFTYFGLSILGVGSILFISFCPEIIREEPNQYRHVNSVEQGVTPLLDKSNLTEALEIHQNNIPFDDKYGCRPHPTYPDHLGIELSELMKEMWPINEVEFGSECEDDPDLFDFKGNLNYDALIPYLLSPTKEHIAQAMSFWDKASNFSKDIALIHYRSLDYGRYKIRFLIALLYGTGFLLLSIPAVKTFWFLSTNAIKSYF